MDFRYYDQGKIPDEIVQLMNQGQEMKDVLMDWEESHPELNLEKVVSDNKALFSYAVNVKLNQQTLVMLMKLGQLKGLTDIVELVFIAGYYRAWQQARLDKMEF